jgi:LAO/AO transport system kinase
MTDRGLAGVGIDELVERIVGGDRLVLARALTMIERGEQTARALLKLVLPHTGRAWTVGVTGPPGAGKSTLLEALITCLRRRERQVGVLSVDPSSPINQGALLGDRLRMGRHYLDEGVFIRSMASRGMVGGLAPMALQSALLLDAAGFNDILIETMGVGQSEIAIARQADAVVLVLMPGAGDSIQLLKCGVMEIPDVIVVNKADHILAKRLLADVRSTLESVQRDQVPAVVQTVASTGDGIEQLATALAEHRDRLEHDGLELRRAQRLREAVVDAAAALVAEHVKASAAGDPEVHELLAAATDRRLDPGAAAARIAARELGRK